MITITIRKNASGEYTGIQAIGHAGYAASGEDIVCSAVSMLFINTINAIEVLTPDKDLMHLVENEEAGLIDCSFRGRPLSEKSCLLIDAMVLGLQHVQEEYSKKYVKLIFEEVQ